MSSNSALSTGSCDSSEMVLLDNKGHQALDDEHDDDDDEEADDLQEEHLAMVPVLEGQLKKRLLKKAGKNVSVSRTSPP